MPRNTRTGAVLEKMVIHALKQGGYTMSEQTRIGERPNGRKHMVDVVAMKGKKKLIISLKWQQTSGTAEQKVPYEVICLLEAVNNKHADKAYLVLGGSGWTLRDYYVAGGLKQHLKYADLVEILTLEDFVSVANQGKL